MSDEYRQDGRIAKKFYESEHLGLQEELVDLQEWIKQEGLRVAVIFEGRDAAGKGGVIKRITQRLNLRVVRVVALGIPTERERSQNPDQGNDRSGRRTGPPSPDSPSHTYLRSASLGELGSEGAAHRTRSVRTVQRIV